MRATDVKRVTVMLLAALLLAGLLAGCGKKSDPKPPAGDDAPFPRTYPSTTS
jgi:predicted small lipoprotein YifL